MQEAFERRELALSVRPILEIASELSSDCATAVVRQARRSLRAGADAVVIDLSGVEPLSLFGLARLLERAKTAGVLSRLVFQSSDLHVQRFLANMRLVQTKYDA